MKRDEKLFFRKNKGGKPTIVIDVDDTLINSTEVVVNALSEKYKFTEKTKNLPIKDVYDSLSNWEYFYFFCKADDPMRLKIDKDVKHIFESEMFWENVVLK